jgi:hypothetical protein
MIRGQHAAARVQRSPILAGRRGSRLGGKRLSDAAAARLLAVRPIRAPRSRHLPRQRCRARPRRTRAAPRCSPATLSNELVARAETRKPPSAPGRASEWGRASPLRPGAAECSVDGRCRLAVAGFEQASIDAKRRELCLSHADSGELRQLDVHSFRRACNTALANVQTAVRRSRSAPSRVNKTPTAP